jgi:hypothetical protein
VIYEVLTVFLDMMPCWLVVGTDIFEEFTATISQGLSRPRRATMPGQISVLYRLRGSGYHSGRNSVAVQQVDHR